MNTRNRSILLLILTFISIILFSGCWNYRELERYAIVSGLAIDKGGNGNKYLLTAEIVDIKAEDKGGKLNSKRIEAKGVTNFDAIRNMIKISAKKLYWSHAKVIILSQDVAREGIIPILDLMNRDTETRLSIDIFVSKEKTAKELLEQQSITTDIRSFEMDFMLTANESLSKAPKVEIYKFINALSGEGISGILPAIGVVLNQGEKTAELSGTAVFKKDKLIGFLDEVDTKYLLFVKDQIKGGVLVENENKGSSLNSITLEIFKNKTKVKPVYKNGKLSISISIKTVVFIGEHDTTESYIDEKGRAKLKTDSEKRLEKNIISLIENVQENYGADIFGFGSIVKAEMPSLWKKIGPKWEEMFKNLDVNVKAEVEIKNSALSSKPIKAGD